MLVNNNVPIARAIKLPGAIKFLGKGANVPTKAPIHRERGRPSARKRSFASTPLGRGWISSARGIVACIDRLWPCVARRAMLAGLKNGRQLSMDLKRNKSTSSSSFVVSRTGIYIIMRHFLGRCKVYVIYLHNQNPALCAQPYGRHGNWLFRWPLMQTNQTPRREHAIAMCLRALYARNIPSTLRKLLIPYFHSHGV